MAGTAVRGVTLGGDGIGMHASALWHMRSGLLHMRPNNRLRGGNNATCFCCWNNRRSAYGRKGP